MSLAEKLPLRHSRAPVRRNTKPVGQAFEPGEDCFRRPSLASAPAFPAVLTSCASCLRKSKFRRRFSWDNGIRSIPRMRQNGTIKFFNQAKGYGFVSPEG